MPHLHAISPPPRSRSASGPSLRSAKKPILTVYTYSGFPSEYGPGGTIKERFERPAAARSNGWRATTPARCLPRLKLEGAGSNADVVLGLDTNQIADAEATGLFAPARGRPERARAAGPVDGHDLRPVRLGLVRLRLQRSKSSPSRRRASPSWSMRRTDRRSSSRIRAPRRRGSACSSGCAAIYGDKAADAWRKLAPKIVTVTQGWTEAYGLFLKGEADMVLSYTTSPAYHIGVEHGPEIQGGDLSGRPPPARSRWRA